MLATASIFPATNTLQLIPQKAIESAPRRHFANQSPQLLGVEIKTVASSHNVRLPRKLTPRFQLEHSTAYCTLVLPRIRTCPAASAFLKQT
jgi:hypothetical protein